MELVASNCVCEPQEMQSVLGIHVSLEPVSNTTAKYWCGFPNATLPMYCTLP